MEKWEKNIRALAEKNELLAERMKEIILQDKIEKVQAKELDNGEKILTVERNGYLWHLNSRLDPEGAADLYAKRYEIKPFYKYFIFGLSDGRAIRKLLDQCDESNALIICEPNAEILAEAFRQFDFEEILLDKRVWLCISEMKNDIYRTVFATVEYSYIKLLEFCILPGYDVLYTEECSKFIDEVIERISYEVAHKNTFITFNRKIPQNMLFHMKHMIGQRNVGQIKEYLKKTGVEGIPAIIVAAGPSLDKNIKELKKAEGKAFIFVVDAALKTAIREGIQPDLVCTVDPKAPERFYETVGEQEFLWCCSSWTNRYPVKNYGKKVFYYNSVVPWWDGVIQEELDYVYPKIESGGCVSAEAFQVACYLGFQTIVFIGQDLAFTGGQSHTKGIEGVLGDNDAYIKTRRLTQVEDVDGNLLYTDFQMDVYRQWFEKKIKYNEDHLRVIDATEGGAKIQGSKVLTLKETIEQECRHPFGIHQILENIPPAFDETKQQRLYHKMEKLEELKEDFRKQVEKGIFLEQELKEKAHSLNRDETAARLKEIALQTEKIDHHPFAAWIMLYTREEEFRLKEDILVKEDMEIEEMMERSIRLLLSFQAGIPLFEEDYKEVISG